MLDRINREVADEGAASIQTGADRSCTITSPSVRPPGGSQRNVASPDSPRATGSHIAAACLLAAGPGTCPAPSFATTATARACLELLPLDLHPSLRREKNTTPSESISEMARWPQRSPRRPAFAPGGLVRGDLDLDHPAPVAIGPAGGLIRGRHLATPSRSEAGPHMTTWCPTRLPHRPREPPPCRPCRANRESKRQSFMRDNACAPPPGRTASRDDSVSRERRCHDHNGSRRFLWVETFTYARGVPNARAYERAWGVAVSMHSRAVRPLAFRLARGGMSR